MTFYTYKVQYFHEVDHVTLTATGIVCGETYADVIQSLEHWYGKSNIIEILSLYALNDSCVLELTEELVAEVRKYDE